MNDNGVRAMCRSILESHGEPMSNDNAAPVGKGGFVIIDDEKLDKDCWRLMGGIEALEAAAMTLKAIREKCTVVQERMFLLEIRDLLKQMAEQHKTVLAAHAMKIGAGKLHEDVPQGAKAN